MGWDGPPEHYNVCHSPVWIMSANRLATWSLKKHAEGPHLELFHYGGTTRRQKNRPAQHHQDHSSIILNDQIIALRSEMGKSFTLKECGDVPCVLEAFLIGAKGASGFRDQLGKMELKN